MTTSASRPSSAARTAASCPGRKAGKPNTSRSVSWTSIIAGQPYRRDRRRPAATGVLTHICCTLGRGLAFGAMAGWHRWALAGALITFGFLGAASIGLPFLLAGTLLAA